MNNSSITQGSDHRMPKRFIEDNKGTHGIQNPGVILDNHEEEPNPDRVVTTTATSSEGSSSAELGVLALVFLLAWGILS